MADVIPIERALPHRVGELICVGCHYRAIHVWPARTPLRSLECDECGKVGLLISTGQLFDDDGGDDPGVAGPT